MALKNYSLSIPFSLGKLCLVPGLRFRPNSISLIYWFSTRGIFTLPWAFGNTWRHSCGEGRGTVGCYWYLVSRGRGCCHTATIHRTVPLPRKKLSGKISDIENPLLSSNVWNWFKEEHLIHIDLTKSMVGAFSWWSGKMKFCQWDTNMEESIECGTI